MSADRRGHRVLIVDDDDGLRGLIRIAFEAADRFELVGEAPDGRTALSLLESSTPELVVLDLGLPDVTGFDLIPRIHALAPSARIVIFSGTDSPPDSQLSMLPAGTRYVVKGDVERLLAALDQVVSVASSEEAARAFRADLASTPEARCFVADTCRRWNCGDQVDDLCLIVSELATNALTHARSKFEVRLRRTNQLVRIEVTDRATDVVPDPQSPTVMDEHGRGLLLVSALSHAWGIEPADNGKVVWAEVLLVPK